MDDIVPLDELVGDEVVQETVVDGAFEAERIVSDSVAWRSVTVPSRLNKLLHDPLSSSRVCEGASILPFAVDPLCGQPFFLLAQQPFNKADPHRGSRWGFPGGVCREGETPVSTAAREFVEETGAVLRFHTDDILPLRTFADIDRSLQNGCFLFSVQLLYMSADRPCSYTLFVRQVPWDAGFPRKFGSVQTALRKQHGHNWSKMVADKHPAIAEHTTTRVRSVRHEFQEVAAFAWWSRPQLESAVFNRMGVLVDYLGQAYDIRAHCVAPLHIVLKHFATFV